MDINELIAKHKGLVYKQLHKFKLLNDPEAESIAYEALYNAIRNFDSTTGNALSTVATVYIYNALGSYVRKLNKQRQLQVVSYHNVAYGDESDSHEHIEFLPASNSVEKDYMHKELCKMTLEAFDYYYNKLTNDKHKAIINEWRESEFSAQTTDIAETLSVSQSYVSQVINVFKHNLRKELEEAYYD